MNSFAHKFDVLELVLRETAFEAIEGGLKFEKRSLCRCWYGAETLVGGVLVELGMSLGCCALRCCCSRQEIR